MDGAKVRVDFRSDAHGQAELIGDMAELRALIRDLRRTSASLSSLTDKLDQQGAGAVIGGSKLPDYKK